MEDTKIKAIAVGVIYQNNIDFDYSIHETIALANACDIEVVGTITQNLPNPSANTYVGSGKVNDIKNMVELYDASLCIFNDELSPAVLNNLADLLECEIIDRTMLILKIFELRAKTTTAKIQVELANLNYMLPRLIGMHKNLDRISTSSGSFSSRGSGEKAIELDRRHIEEKINKLKKDLDDITLDRYTTRNKRKKNDIKTVAFVGYTNAGKSTTINSILKYVDADTEKQVFVKDMLFATLETQTRRIKLDNNHIFLITDTVGFVSNLPHHLIESFKSTLEEIKEADLIVHIIDSSSPYLDKQVNVTNDVLKELGANNIPILYCYNKKDLINNYNMFDFSLEPNIVISNNDINDIVNLINHIDNMLFDDLAKEFLLPYTKGDIYNILKENATIKETKYLDNGIYVSCNLSKHLYALYKDYEIKK